MFTKIFKIRHRHNSFLQSDTSITANIIRRYSTGGSAYKLDILVGLFLKLVVYTEFYAFIYKQADCVDIWMKLMIP